jgi:hypothetical protein
MKLIYYYVPGADSGYVLTNEEYTNYSSAGFYYFTDILGRDYRLPIANTFFWSEEFDGDEQRLPNRYKKALEEMKGNESGIIKKKE